MNRRTGVLLAAGLAAIGLTVGGFATLRQDQAAPGQGTGGPVTAAAAEPPVEFGASDTLVVEPVEIARSIPLTGSLRAANQTIVRSKTSGEIRELTVREGMPVQRGQLIARIDPAEAEQRLREREAQLASADAQLAQAKRDLDTNRALIEKGFLSQSAFDRARSTYDMAAANKQALAAQMALARKALADTTVAAPMGGIVAERFAQAGERVSPDARIVSIIDLSKMEIEAPVPAEDVARVRVGQPVELRIEGIDRTQVGRVARIAPSTQAGSRSVPVYITLDNQDERVRAGLFAQGSLALERKAGVIAVPYAAVRDRAGRNFVYAIEADRVVERDVRTGLRDDAARAPNGATGLIEITGGLKAGDRIVAVNLGTLRTGAPARIEAVAAAH